MAGRYRRLHETVHPHGRGDNAPRRPLTPDRRRFTPTGVGTMGWRRRTESQSSVHPHGRGDNNTVTTRNSLPSGSPPRAWGQSDAGSPQHHARRFTPTGVGTIGSARLIRASTPVHPHGRGDNIQRNRLLGAARFGSPPRAWGQCPPGRAIGERGTVHPHGRGDNRLSPEQEMVQDGSPPRAWGQ